MIALRPKSVISHELSMKSSPKKKGGRWRNVGVPNLFKAKIRRRGRHEEQAGILES